MARKSQYYVFIIILVVTNNPLKITGHEKTLRKIVRNQAKMVQTYFSDNGGADIFSRNFHELLFPGYVSVKTKEHGMQLPKISKILTSSKAENIQNYHSKMKMRKNENIINESRLIRNINNTLPHRLNTNTSLFGGSSPKNQSGLFIENYYQIPIQSKFFPPIDDRELQSVDMKTIEKDIITFPEPIGPGYVNNTSLFKGMFVAKSELKAHSSEPNTPNNIDSDKADFLLESLPAVSNSFYSYNYTSSPYLCRIVEEIKSDIDADEKFSEFDIESQWVGKKHFWNTIYDSRYESLMRNSKWPPLQVILMPRSHVNSIWKKSFEAYHNDVHKIITNIVKKLQFYNDFTFTWNEVSHLSVWWKTTSQKSRSVFRKLLKSGRLEITTGGWVETDEATSDLFGLVHQLIEGHQWLKYHLNYQPKVAWLTNSVTHSSTIPYIFSASDISQLIFTNIHFSWQHYLAEYQISDFIWIQNWEVDHPSSPLNNVLNKIGKDRYAKHSVLAHYLQFNSDSFKACGPNKEICTSEFNFVKSDRNLDINVYNIKDKAEKLLEQYSKTGTLSSHNIVIAPIGGSFHYELLPEFDYQYNNYKRLTDFVNYNSDIYKAKIKFGTPTDYFTSILKKNTDYPTFIGDFLNFADLNSGTPAYWTGFYTTRPQIKILLRRLHSTLRSTEILFSFAVSLNAFRRYNTSYIFDILIQARENVARLQDRHVVSGTLNANTMKYTNNLILTTVKDCWYIQEISTSLLSTKQDQSVPYVQKYVYRDGEFISTFKTVAPEDQIYVFNSLSHERTEVVKLVTRYPNIRVLDHTKKDVTVQINPVWTYRSENNIRISRTFFKIVFTITVPPMTLELFSIKETYDAMQNAATLYCLACSVDDVVNNDAIFPFNIQPLQRGDIQLESYKYRLIFDELSGFLKTVVEKQTNKERMVILNYGAFRSSHINSGMFLFNTNVSKPLYDILLPYRLGLKLKLVLIVSGIVTTEITTIYGRLLQHTVKIFNLLYCPLADGIFVESKLDYEASPKNREMEIYMSIQTDVGNGNAPKIFTDNNGFQFTARTLNISRRIESNMYPITTMAYIQDEKSRMTVITDHAQGVTALQEGQLIIMLDRRVLFNDGRGTNEGLDDNSVTCHRHYILLENIMQSSNSFIKYNNHNVLNLPSLSAVQLANSLNYQLDLFIIDKNQTHLCYFAFLPLIKTAFPCDVSVIAYRVILNRGSAQYLTPNTALMVMHRQTFSCYIEHSIYLHCDGENKFSIDKILRNTKAVYHTNLVGTSKGSPLLNYNYANFPQMELMTIRVYF